MDKVYQLRVYGHHIDKDGIRENQLIGPIYTSKPLAEEDAKRLATYPMYSKVEVEELNYATTNVYMYYADYKTKVGEIINN